MKGFLKSLDQLNRSTPYLRNIGGFAIGTTFLLLPTIATAQIQRSFINPSFEQPPFGSPGQQCYVQVLPSTIPGWETTHGAVRAGGGNCSGYISPGVNPLIEIWTSGFNSAFTAANGGNQFAELNAEQNSQLYQNLCLYQGETITFSFLHRGRSRPDAADVANFLIGLNTDPSSTIFGTFSTTNNGTVTAQPVAQNGAIIPNVSNNNAANGWVRYDGTVPYTGVTGNRPVGFAAVSTGGGRDTVGNFLDNAQFAGNPVIEFSTSSGGGPEAETNPTTNPPQLRIVGLVPPGGLIVPITVSGTATIGTDFNTTSGTTTFNMTIPAGNYDGSNATSLFSIPFTVNNNNIPQGGRLITFTIQPSSNFFASSTTTCGSSPIIASDYTIYDDDFISGTVWNDADNSANNTFTNINTASETGTNATGLLYAILVDASNNVLKTTPVAADGTYTFLDVPLNQTDVTIILSTTPGTVNNPAPAPAVPPNWVNTSPLATAAFNTGTSVSNRDFGIRLIPNDYGDAPDAYGDASHTIPITPTTYLGSTPPDVESDTQLGDDAGVGADGDDGNGTDDEDGVVLSNLTAGTTLAVPVTVTGNGALNAWIDWDGNGSFDAGEQIATDAVDGGTGDTDSTADGTITLSVTAPATATVGNTYARFRYSSQTGLSPTGSASDGEVEDYAVTIAAPVITVSISGIVFNDVDGSQIQNGGETGTNAGGLNAILIDGSGDVVATTAIDGNGTYAFNDIVSNQNGLTISLSTIAGTIGSPAPTSSLPPNWLNTTPLTSAAFDIGTSNISNQNFGIRIQNADLSNDFCQTSPDMVFILDDSSSVNSTEVQQQRDAVMAMLNHLVSNNIAARAAIVGFDSGQRTVIDYTDVNAANLPAFQTALNTNYGVPGSGTNWPSGFQQAESLGLVAGQPDVVFFFSDGLSYGGGDPSAEAEKFKLVGAHIYGVWIDSDQNLTLSEFQAITDGPNTLEFTGNNANEADYIQVDNYSELVPEVTALIEGICPATAIPNMLLVKRITALNGLTMTNAGDNLGLYQDEAGNPYDDNTVTITAPPATAGDPRQDTDKWPDPNTFLIGGINGGTVMPNDEIEYTIYFLSAGDNDANNVLLCDRVPENVTYMPTAYSAGATAGAQYGIQLNIGGTITNLTGTQDSDVGQFFPIGVDPTTVFPSINCGGSNTNGAVVVNLGNLPNATAPSTPPGSYGFVRFKGKIK